MLGNYQSRSDNIFRAALFLSVLLHLVAIQYLRLPELAEPMRGKAALSVILAEPQDVGRPVPEPPTPIPAPVLQQPLEVPKPPPLEAAVKDEQTTPPMDIAKPIPQPKSEPTSGETLQETPADPVESNQEIVEAGKVQALLLVDYEGKVTQIIWKTLPAIADETLQQIEQQLRARIYLATGKTYTVYEIVELPRE